MRQRHLNRDVVPAFVRQILRDQVPQYIAHLLVKADESPVIEQPYGRHGIDFRDGIRALGVVGRDRIQCFDMVLVRSGRQMIHLILFLLRKRVQILEQS